ncbi:MAG: ABC transporter ATP-binding protein [Mucilaginibacter polytrichastri]|nr:ABC transporter ATP-binding protein [Mucilaginibacter polytrichastri]
MIRLEHIRKTFGGRNVLDDISLDIAAGETFVLLGASGCGKTTTLKTINRLIAPDSGEVFFDGKNTREISTESLRRQMGYVLQNTGLFPHYTIYENVAVVPKLLKWTDTDIRRRAEMLFEKLHLPLEYFGRQPAELSGGQQQRVGLARALMADPPAMLMDEPFGALDPVIRHRIRSEFSTLDEWKSKTIVLVTHDVEEAFILGDRIALMDKGKILQVGRPLDFLTAPADETVKTFFAAQRYVLLMHSMKLNEIWPGKNGGENSIFDLVQQNAAEENTDLAETLSRFNQKVLAHETKRD